MKIDLNEQCKGCGNALRLCNYNSLLKEQSKEEHKCIMFDKCTHNGKSVSEDWEYKGCTSKCNHGGGICDGYKLIINESWEKSFYEEFGKSLDELGGYGTNKRLKQFIKSLLQREREKIERANEISRGISESSLY